MIFLIFNFNFNIFPPFFYFVYLKFYYVGFDYFLLNFRKLDIEVVNVEGGNSEEERGKERGKSNKLLKEIICFSVFLF